MTALFNTRPKNSVPVTSLVNSWVKNQVPSIFSRSLRKDAKEELYEKGRKTTIDFFVDEQGELLALENYNTLSKVHSIDAIQPNLNNSVFSKKAKLLDYWFVGRDSASKKLFYIDELKKEISDSRNRALFSLDLESGEVKPELVNSKKDIVDVIYGENREVLGVVYGGLYPSVKFLDQQLDEKFKAISNQFPGHLVRLESWSRGFADMVVYVTGPKIIGDYFIFTQGKKPRLLAKTYPDVNHEGFQSMVSIEYKASDGLPIQALVVIPKKRQKESKLPAIIMPNASITSSANTKFNPLNPSIFNYPKIEFKPLTQYLAKLGYVVIQPQVRLSNGYGGRHILAGYGEFGRKTISDIVDAIDHFADANVIDPKRVCIIGARFGGYSALAAEAFYPDRFDCVVSVNGISDLSDIHHHRWKSLSRNYLEVFLSESTFNSSSLSERSPINFSKNYNSPVLLIRSEKDGVVRAEQFKKMKKKLKKQKIPLYFKEISEADHYFSTADSRMVLFSEISSFLNEHFPAYDL